MDVVFLGTGARWPTPERGVSATVIAYGGQHVLIDCGEGTQRQMMRSTTGFRGLVAVALTHLHADHVLGLPGLLATLDDGRRAPLIVAGPAGTGALAEEMGRFFGEPAYPLDVREVVPGTAVRFDGFDLIAVASRHRVPSLAWIVEEHPLPGHLQARKLRQLGVPPGPDWHRLAGGGDIALEDGRRLTAAEVTGPARTGRRIVLSGDTAPAADVAVAAKGADLLVHEATFVERDRELARRTGHSTAADAARIAARAGVGLLAVTHRSSRYRRERVLQEARAVFARCVAPEDLDLVRVPLPERGRPVLLAGGGRSVAAGTAPRAHLLPAEEDP
jgi:ribonuclease Z